MKITPIEIYASNGSTENVIFEDTLKKIVLEEISFLKAHGDEENVHLEIYWNLLNLSIFIIPLAQIT